MATATLHQGHSGRSFLPSALFYEKKSIVLSSKEDDASMSDISSSSSQSRRWRRRRKSNVEGKQKKKSRSLRKRLSLKSFRRLRRESRSSMKPKTADGARSQDDLEVPGSLTSDTLLLETCSSSEAQKGLDSPIEDVALFEDLGEDRLQKKTERFAEPAPQFSEDSSQEVPSFQTNETVSLKSCSSYDVQEKVDSPMEDSSLMDDDGEEDNVHEQKEKAVRFGDKAECTQVSAEAGLNESATIERVEEEVSTPKAKKSFLRVLLLAAVAAVFLLRDYKK